MMAGRFASTVALHQELRPPYPPLFFREVAARLPLTPAHALIEEGEICDLDLEDYH